MNNINTKAKMLDVKPLVTYYMEPKTCINYFQKENYAFNINQL